MPAQHEITRTTRRAEGGTLHGWECSCGEMERPRYAAAEDADRSAERHTEAAS